MIEWSETDLLIRDSVREFIDKEIRPNLDALESGQLPPYPILRKLFADFGLDVVAAEAVKGMLDKKRARQDAVAAGETAPAKSSSGGGLDDIGAQASMGLILVSELSGVSLGLVAAVGVSLGLGAPPS